MSAWKPIAAASCAAALLLLLAGARAQVKEEAIGRHVAGFSLPDTSGKQRTLAEFADRKAVVIVFLGTECPIANSYSEPLSLMEQKLRAKGVQFLGVNANPDEDADAVKRHAAEYRLSFPVLKDEHQRLAEVLDARVTPEAFVLDATRVVRYRGRIDDSYVSRTEKRARVTSRDLERAIEELLQGKPVSRPVTKAFGCGITRVEKADKAGQVTYHRDVAPILEANCQSCHRPGQVAPFSLTSFADAKKWGEEIKLFTSSRQMPPWLAEPGHGEFADSRRMADRDIETLARWVDAGMPEGEPAAGRAPKEWPDGWMLGEPDLVLTMPEPYHVSATGEDDFRCFVLPTGLAEEKQVVAVEVRPGNPRVVHHVLNFLDSSGRARQLDAADDRPGYSSGPGGIGFFPGGSLGGWAPGNFPRRLPDGVGMPLAKGSDLVIQVHYHKTGKPETDQTRIGLYFADRPIEKIYRVLPVTSLNINIPPGAERHEVRAVFPVFADAHALTITPHMHLLGKEMRVTARMPDGATKELIWVKNWDYRWQDTYRFKEPVPLPRGTRVEMVAVFDNSEKNPRNPNSPPKRVTFGEQTTDEMAFAFLGFTLDRERTGVALRRPGFLGGAGARLRDR